jgi:hypothetical protein
MAAGKGRAPRRDEAADAPPSTGHRRAPGDPRPGPASRSPPGVRDEQVQVFIAEFDHEHWSKLEP